MVEALRDWGCDVRPYEPDGQPWWDHTTEGAWHPAGVMHHHTTGPRSILSDTGAVAATLKVLRRGRPGLPGPLCHAAPAMIPGTNRARVWMIGWANTNHAGTGSSRTLGLIRDGRYDGQKPGADDTEGNPWFFGLEYCHPGDATRWPDALLEQGHRAGAALCEFMGHPRTEWAGRQCEHKEWTVRKVDRSWKGDVRRAVTKIIQARGEEDMSLTDAEIKRVVDAMKAGLFDADVVPAALPAPPEATPANPTWQVDNTLGHLLGGVRELVDRPLPEGHDDLRAVIDEQTAALTTLTNAVADLAARIPRPGAPGN
jgi:hypothetical protein